MEYVHYDGQLFGTYIHCVQEARAWVQMHGGQLFGVQ